MFSGNVPNSSGKWSMDCGGDSMKIKCFLCGGKHSAADVRSYYVGGSYSSHWSIDFNACSCTTETTHITARGHIIFTMRDSRSRAVLVDMMKSRYDTKNFDYPKSLRVSDGRLHRNGNNRSIGSISSICIYWDSRMHVGDDAIFVRIEANSDVKRIATKDYSRTAAEMNSLAEQHALEVIGEIVAEAGLTMDDVVLDITNIKAVLSGYG